MNDITNNAQQNLMRLGLITLGILILDSLLTNEDDTVNYVLWHRGQKVYHSICFEDRIESRIYEHECTGKVFDEYSYGRSKPRDKACTLEIRRIRRDQTKYNIQHN